MTTPRVTFPTYYIDQLTHLNYSQVFLDDLVELNFANLRQQARRVATFLLSYNKVSNPLSIYKKKKKYEKERKEGKNMEFEKTFENKLFNSIK